MESLPDSPGGSPLAQVHLRIPFDESCRVLGAPFLVLSHRANRGIAWTIACLIRFESVIRLLISPNGENEIRAFWGHYSSQVFGLYLERPRGDASVSWLPGGRFRYSDLKEAAPVLRHLCILNVPRLLIR